MDFEIKDFQVHKEKALKATATVYLHIGSKPILSVMEVKLIEKRNGTLLLCMPGRYAGKPFVRVCDTSLHNSIQRALIKKWIAANDCEKTQHE